MWDYGRHFCLINRCRVYVSFCFPEGWLKGHETFHVAVVFVSHTRYCCWFNCSSPHQMGSTCWKISWLHLHDVSARFACQNWIQLTSSLATFIPATEVSSLYHLFSSFYSSSSHRQMTCQDGYEFIGGEQGTQPSRSAQWIGWFQLLWEGIVCPCFCQREETMRVKYPIRFFLVKYACVEHSITQSFII